MLLSKPRPGRKCNRRWKWLLPQNWPLPLHRPSRPRRKRLNPRRRPLLPLAGWLCRKPVLGLSIRRRSFRRLPHLLQAPLLLQAQAFNADVRFSIAGRPVLPVARVVFSARKVVRPVRVNSREVPVPSTPHALRREVLLERERRGVRQGVQDSGHVPVLGRRVQEAALVRVREVGLVPVGEPRLPARLRDRRVDQEPPGAAAASSTRRPRKAR